MQGAKGAELGLVILIDAVAHRCNAVPGEGMVEFRHVEGTSPFVATHLTLSVDRAVDEVVALADRAGWRTQVVSRGPHDVIELWVENAVMVEVMTPEMTDDFLAAVRPD